MKSTTLAIHIKYLHRETCQ